jgi:hypothetical protein
MRLNKIVMLVCVAGLSYAATPDGAEEVEEEVFTGADFTPEAMKEQSKKDFDDLDTNKDGFLTKAELVAYLTSESSGDHKMSEEDAQKEVDGFFDQADEDNNDQIDFEEYYRFVLALYEKYKQQSENQEMPMHGDFGDEDFDFGDFDFGDEEL